MSNETNSRVERERNQEKSLLPLYIYQLLEAERGKTLSQKEVVERLQMQYGLNIRRQMVADTMKLMVQENLGVMCSPRGYSLGKWGSCQLTSFDMAEAGSVEDEGNTRERLAPWIIALALRECSGKGKPARKERIHKAIDAWPYEFWLKDSTLARVLNTLDYWQSQTGVHYQPDCGAWYEPAKVLQAG